MDKKTAVKFMRLFYARGLKVRWTRFGCEIPVPHPIPKEHIEITSPSLSVIVSPDQHCCELYFTDAKQKRTWIYRTNGSDADLLEVVNEHGVVFSSPPPFWR